MKKDTYEYLKMLKDIFAMNLNKIGSDGTVGIAIIEKIVQIEAPLRAPASLKGRSLRLKQRRKK